MWRFRRKRLLVLFLALGLATVATAAVGGRGTQVQTAKVPEVVAELALSRGSVLAAGELRQVLVPAGYRIPAAVARPADAVGLVLTADLAPGEPLSHGELQTTGAAGLNYQIPSGLRAESLAVSQVSGVGGHLEPGDRIDAVVVITQGAPGSSLASLFLTDVPVLAVESPMRGGVGGGSTGYASVTLAVSPMDATRLALAEQTGTVQLLLRPAGETGRPRLQAGEGSFGP